MAEETKKEVGDKQTRIIQARTTSDLVSRPLQHIARRGERAMASTTTHARIGTTMAAAASTSDARARLGAPAARLPARAAPLIPRRSSRCRPRSRVVVARASGADDDPNPAPRPCDLYDVSDVLTPYAAAWSWQRAILQARLDALADGVGESDALGARDCLLVVQHPPVVTLGTGSTPDNLKFDPDDPAAPFEVHRTERGGEATYHGPGQIVLYPIVNLRDHEPDLHWYMRSLEEVAIIAMEDLGVRDPGRVEGLTGAWANVPRDPSAVDAAAPQPLFEREHKLAAIGVRARRWVTYHGMAFNVDPILTDFSHIVPCGIGDRPVGSVAQMLGGGAGIVSSSFGAVDGGGDDGPGRGSCGGGGFSVDAAEGPDARLMERAREALLAAYEDVFGVELIRRGGPPVT